MDREHLYVRYYVGRKGKFGHEFLEFELKANGRLRYANNSNYRREELIRKEVHVADIVLREVKGIVEQSNILAAEDTKWPEPNRDGRQELEIRLGNVHICFITSEIGSFSEVQRSQDPRGLQAFYYLVQDLKTLVFSLINSHFRVKPV